MITIALEDFADCIEDVASLLTEHWREVAWYKDKMSLSPNWEKYQQLASSESMRIFVARDAGKIVGYSIYFVGHNLHYKNTIVADNDITYIAPEYRHGRTAVDLLNYVNDSLKEGGVSLVSVKMKSDTTFHSLMEKLDYNMMEFNYTKWIGD